MSSSSSFGAWFSAQQAGSAPGGSSSGGGAAASAQPASSSRFGFGSLFGGKPPANDVESGNLTGSGGATGAEDASESSSFLPGFVRNSGLFGQSAPPPSEWACGMSLTQRIQVGILLLFGAGILFMAAIFVFLPMALIMPSKFATSFSVGSLLFMAAMAMFRGPRTFLMGFLDWSRAPFTVAYLGSLIMTLWATLGGRSYLLIVLAVCAQVAALLWYASTFIPGGTTGMGFVSRMFLSSAASSARGVAGMVVGRR